MARLLLGLVLMLSSSIQIGRANTWVRIDGEVKEITSRTSCRRIAKKNQLTLCDCCLIKHAVVKQMAGSLAIEKCTKAQHCLYMAALSSEEGAGARVDRAKKNLQEMSIIDVRQFLSPSTIPPKGALSIEAVRSIIDALHHKGYVNALGSSLLIKEIGGGFRGFYSGQLFSVDHPMSSIEPLYFLKETKKGKKEIKNLYRIKTSDLGAENIDATKHVGLAFDRVHFNLKTSKRWRYFSLLQAARGESLHQHLAAFGDIAVNNASDFGKALSRMEKMFFRIGYGLSEFHQRYAKKVMGKTYTHGDLHSDNIFIDEHSGQITLIDNETFALSLKHKNAGVDDLIDLYVVHTIKTLARKMSKQVKTNLELGIDDRTWHALWYQLIDGYLSAYGQMDREEFFVLFDSFREKFLRGYSQSIVFSPLRNLTDHRKLRRLGSPARRSVIEREHLRPLFNRLLSNKIAAYEGGQILGEIF